MPKFDALLDHFSKGKWSRSAPGSAGRTGFRRAHRVPPGAPGSAGRTGFRRAHRVPPGAPG
ncbi:hypothetical protein, partial [Collinsella stercoris]|uniref:hypothetical protein n=1 Tax=Collinsella stercoris TaxID=147206 RepID=UPI003AF09260